MQQCVLSFIQLSTWSKSLEIGIQARQGPYDIIAVHTNGTLTIQLNAHTTECISIQNVKPFLRN
jgi:hypothetical protein